MPTMRDDLQHPCCNLIAASLADDVATISRAMDWVRACHTDPRARRDALVRVACHIAERLADKLDELDREEK
jgi:hypothetical protein